MVDFVVDVLFLVGFFGGEGGCISSRILHARNASGFALQILSKNTLLGFCRSSRVGTKFGVRSCDPVCGPPPIERFGFTKDFLLIMKLAWAKM